MDEHIRALIATREDSKNMDGYSLLATYQGIIDKIIAERKTNRMFQEEIEIQQATIKKLKWRLQGEKNE